MAASGDSQPAEVRRFAEAEGLGRALVEIAAAHQDCCDLIGIGEPKA